MLVWDGVSGLRGAFDALSARPMPQVRTRDPLPARHKKPRMRGVPRVWRRGGDSNPRTGVNPLTVFETAAFDHSATSPNLSRGSKPQVTVTVLGNYRDRPLQRRFMLLQIRVEPRCSKPRIVEQCGEGCQAICVQFPCSWQVETDVAQPLGQSNQRQTDQRTGIVAAEAFEQGNAQAF